MHAIILGSGSKGNSTLIISREKKILIDVGFSYPKMSKLLGEYGLTPKDIDSVLITHTHKDHVGGLSTFLKRTYAPVYTNINMYHELLKIVPDANLIVEEDEFSIGDLNVEVIHTSHDAVGSVGFVINNDESSLVYITDTGYINKTYLKRLKNKNVYIFESNHDINMLMTGPYPYILKQRVVGDKGHLSNEMAGNYLKEIVGDKTKRIILAHLSEINNTPDVAIKTVKEILNKDIELDTAFQDETLDVGEI